MGSPSYRECEKVELIGICLVMAGICANCRGLMKGPNFCFLKKMNKFRRHFGQIVTTVNSSIFYI